MVATKNPLRRVFCWARFEGSERFWWGMANGLHALVSPGHIATPLACVIYTYQPRRMRSPEVTDEDQARKAPDRMLGWSQQRTRFGGFFVGRDSRSAGELGRVWQKAYKDWCHLAILAPRRAA
ncbi:hypothetical protein CE139_08270 [Pseudomonas oryzihabitans]|uniref:Uncharacterized protein n=1 Tax=Pseudomonas oryzihabitans TaxID=47885 RepID=A0A2Z5A4U1_9PSED|nr:hypothetical protein CE139_08270 [Pseudomonas oryzihabitans]